LAPLWAPHVAAIGFWVPVPNPRDSMNDRVVAHTNRIGCDAASSPMKKINVWSNGLENP